MSTLNNNTLPKIWQIVEIIHHILSLSEITTIIALARTCKLLYNSINCNSLWLQLYQRNFPRDINIDIDWLQWQLKQEQQVAQAATDAKNKTASKSTYFQLYSQRMNMGLNWQKNKLTSTVHLKSFNKVDGSNLPICMQTIMASYPGWFAILTRWNLQVNLVKLLPKNTTKTYSLDVDKTNLKAIKNIKFYRYRQQVDDADDAIRVILHLEYIENPIHTLQIWNANSCQLLRSIDFDGKWDDRIIDASLLLSNFQDANITQLLCRGLLNARPYEAQSTNISRFNYYDNFRIHTVNGSEMVFLQYNAFGTGILYRVARALLTSDANLVMTNYDASRVIEVILKIEVFFADIRYAKFYSIDYDRVLFYYSTCRVERDSFGNTEFWHRYIKVISLSKGLMLERDYPSRKNESLFLISTHNLVVFYSTTRLPLVTISLLDGEIQRSIDISLLCNKFYGFQHLMDTKIIGCNCATNQYCIIDAVTGDVNVYFFPISEVEDYGYAFGHMLLMNKETTLITSFVPELN